jgi:hypothetical protein
MHVAEFIALYPAFRKTHLESYRFALNSAFKNAKNPGVFGDTGVAACRHEPGG